MSEILFINACISTGHPSRTLFLARYFLKQLAQNTQSKITEIDLTKENLQPLNEKTLATRTADLDSKQLLKPKFHYAHQLAAADFIVVAAPYWDLSFPSILKVFFEHTSAASITFTYTEHGPAGLCKASQLYYLTTSGGVIGEYNFGYDYIRGLCALYGIEKTKLFTAEGLDIENTDVATVMTDACRKIDLYFAQ